MTSNNNKGCFAGPRGGGGPAGGVLWVNTLQPYYRDEKLRLCPTATKPACPQGAAQPKGSTFLAWGFFDTTFMPEEETDKCGSYGINAWVYNPPKAQTEWNNPEHWMYGMKDYAY